MKKSIIISSLLVITLAMSIFTLKKCEFNKDPLAKAMKERPYIDPPFSNITIPLEVYKVNASKGGILKYGKNTEILIPENAFLDKNGQPVKGKVKLGYREFNDPVSAMISGLSMETEEGSGDYLQSAGMLEINAWQNDELLRVNPNSPITVKLRSSFEGEDYNLYNLDTANRKWDETAKDLNVKKIPVPEVEVKAPKTLRPNYDQLAKKAGFSKPEKPVKLDKEKFQFRFKTDFSDQPEINIYNGVQWEFAGKKSSEDPTQNRWVLTASWNEMEIVKRLSEGRYRLKLTSGEKAFKTTVKPVFDAEDMEYAEEVYKEKYEAYRTYVDNKKEEARKLKLEQERLAKLRAKERAKRKKLYATYEGFQREIKIGGFGWINVDKFINENWAPIVASFSSKDNTPIEVSRVYLITDGINSLRTYYPAQKTTSDYNNIVMGFKINLKRKNRIMVIDENSKVYVFGPKYFKTVPAARAINKSHHFISQQKGMEVASAKDIKRVLGLHQESSIL